MTSNTQKRWFDIMKKFAKGYLSGILSGVIVAGSIGVFAAAEQLDIKAVQDFTVKMIIHGKIFEPKEADGSKQIPLLFNGRYYLPVRSVAEATGLAVNWDGATKTVSLLEKSEYTNLEFAMYEDFINTIFTRDSDKLKSKDKTYAWGISSSMPMEVSDTFRCYVKPDNKFKKMYADVYIGEKAGKDQIVEFRKEDNRGEVLKSVTVKAGTTMSVEVDVTGATKVCIEVAANQGAASQIIVGEPKFK